MSTYKLCYFNYKGFGEMIRLLFVEAGVVFEDVRYMDEEWLQRKPEMLFGKMPVLFVDGEQIAHSRAALRYLAREFKLDGGSPLNAAKMDMWIEVFFEAILKLPLQEKDASKKLEGIISAFKENVIPKLSKLEEFIAGNKGVYTFGGNPSAVDFMVQSILEVLKPIFGKEFLEDLPRIKSLMTAVEARPNIAKWILERPITDH